MLQLMANEPDSTGAAPVLQTVLQSDLHRDRSNQ